MFSAIGTSGVLVSSGLLAWQVYQTQVGQQQIVELKEKLSIQQSAAEDAAGGGEQDTVCHDTKGT